MIVSELLEELLVGIDVVDSGLVCFSGRCPSAVADAEQEIELLCGSVSLRLCLKRLLMLRLRLI